MKKRIVLAIGIALSATLCHAENAVGVRYSNDKLGQDFVNDVNVQIKNLTAQKTMTEQQLNNIQQQIDALTGIANARQTAIDYINKERAFKYFTVNKGSFKAQLAQFSDRLQIKTIRWSGVPSCIDWNLDATYDIDMSRTVDGAVDEFLDGMPLNYEYFERDSSLNLTSTVVIKGCPNE